MNQNKIISAAHCHQIVTTTPELIQNLAEWRNHLRKELHPIGLTLDKTIMELGKLSADNTILERAVKDLSDANRALFDGQTDTANRRCLAELESDRGNDNCALCGKLFKSQREAAGTADEPETPS